MGMELTRSLRGDLLLLVAPLQAPFVVTEDGGSHGGGGHRGGDGERELHCCWSVVVEETIDWVLLIV